MNTDLQSSIDLVSRIAAVPTILDVVCRTTGMGFATVARMAQDHWIACSVKDEIGFGIQAGHDLPAEATICHDVHTKLEPVIVNHAAEDPIYSKHPMPTVYGLQSCISVPITLPDGTFFGTLCAFDLKPATLNSPETVGMFKLFAELLAYQIDAANRMTVNDADLVNQRRIGDLREAFISILGHDLRNPIAAIKSGNQLLLRMTLPERARTILGMMEASVDRMTEMVGNMLDLARGRLEGGIPIRRQPGVTLEPVLRQVVSEIATPHPDRSILSSFAVSEPVTCDKSRIGQMFSNLLANAVTHGDPTRPITVKAGTKNGLFTLSVANSGAPIPQDRIEHLFEPFSRGSLRHDQQGLGLGLHIASEIARAHRGTLNVTSTLEETRFTFRMPIHPGDSPQME